MINISYLILDIGFLIVDAKFILSMAAHFRVSFLILTFSREVLFSPVRRGFAETFKVCVDFSWGFDVAPSF